MITKFHNSKISPVTRKLRGRKRNPALRRRFLHIPILFLMLTILLLVTSCDFHRVSKDTKQLEIVYTANLQGAMLDLPCNNTVGKAEFYTIPRTMAKVQEMMEKAKEQGTPAIAVDGGNTLFGIDDLSRSQEGEPVIYLMKKAGCSAMALGEAEFIAGSGTFSPGEKGEGKEEEYKRGGRRKGKEEEFKRRGRGGRGGGKENEKDKAIKGSRGPLPPAEGADFAFFSGNTTGKGFPEIVPSSFTKEIDGIKVSFHSFFEPEESPLLPGVPEKYLFAEFDPSIESLNKKLEKDTAHYKIVIARVNDIQKFAGQLKGADLIIPGRFHDSLLPDKINNINGIPVLPFITSRNLGVSKIRFDKDSKGKVRVSFSMEKPGEAKMPKNADLSLYLDKFYKKYSKEYAKVQTAFIGYGDDRLKHTPGKPQETPTAFVIADMIRNYAGTDVALINLFSVRRPLAGIIRGEDVEWISPFGNKLVTMDLTGEQIRTILKLNLRRDTKFMIISGGSIKYNPGNTIDILIDGSPLNPKKTYRVATNDYLADSDKMEYRVFRLGKNVHKTEIPINGIFFEAVMKRRFIGIPPERVGLKTREEIEKIKDPLKAGKEAYKWGYFKLAHDKLTIWQKRVNEKNNIKEDIDKSNEDLASLYLYCGLPGKLIFSRFVFNEKWRSIFEFGFERYSDVLYNELASTFVIFGPRILSGLSSTNWLFASHSSTRTIANIYIGVSDYYVGNLDLAAYILGRIEKSAPQDIRLRRLAEAVQEAQASLSGRTETAGVPPIWAKFKGDNRNTGRSPYEGPASKKVKVLWKFKTHHSNKSSPAIAADGTVYIAGGDGILYALSPGGKLKWNYSIGGYLLSSPAVDKRGTIYLGAGSTSGESRRQTFREGQAEEKQEKSGHIYAFNPDGTEKWRFQTGGWVASSPLITLEGNIVAGCNDNFVYCMESNGNLVWKFETGGKVFSSPAEDKEGNIYIGSEDFYFYSLDKNGKFRWKYRAENKFFSSPAISDDGIIYTGNDDAHLYAFKPDGTLLWKKKFPEAITSTPSIGRDGDLYVGCEDGKLYRVSPSGDIKWSFEREDEFFSSPIIDKKGNIYIGNEDNFLYCVSPEGKMLWKFETGDYVESTPVVAPDGRVYLNAEDKYFYVIVGG